MLYKSRKWFQLWGESFRVGRSCHLNTNYTIYKYKIAVMNTNEISKRACSGTLKLSHFLDSHEELLLSIKVTFPLVPYQQTPCCKLVWIFHLTSPPCCVVGIFRKSPSLFVSKDQPNETVTIESKWKILHYEYPRHGLKYPMSITSGLTRLTNTEGARQCYSVLISESVTGHFELDGTTK